MDEVEDIRANDVVEKKSKPTEREKLEQEKIKLCTEIGIWGTFTAGDGYESTEQFNRIQEINKRLSEIING